MSQSPNFFLRVLAWQFVGALLGAVALWKPPCPSLPPRWYLLFYSLALYACARALTNLHYAVAGLLAKARQKRTMWLQYLLLWAGACFFLVVTLIGGDRLYMVKRCYRFSIDPLYAQNLDQDYLSPALRLEFERHDVVLNMRMQALTREIHQQWLLRGESARYYRIKREGPVLKVYEEYMPASFIEIFFGSIILLGGVGVLFPWLATLTALSLGFENRSSFVKRRIRELQEDFAQQRRQELATLWKLPPQERQATMRRQILENTPALDLKLVPWAFVRQQCQQIFFWSLLPLVLFVAAPAYHPVLLQARFFQVGLVLTCGAALGWLLWICYSLRRVRLLLSDAGLYQRGLWQEHILLWRAVKQVQCQNGHLRFTTIDHQIYDCDPSIWSQPHAIYEYIFLRAGLPAAIFEIDDPATLESLLGPHCHAFEPRYRSTCWHHQALAEYQDYVSTANKCQPCQSSAGQTRTNSLERSNRNPEKV